MSLRRNMLAMSLLGLALHSAAPSEKPKKPEMTSPKRRVSVPASKAEKNAAKRARRAARNKS